jgi:3-dehydroquinate dehydratase type I
MVKICVPVIETTIGKAVKAVEEAGRVADFVELRLDYLKKPDWPLLLKNRKRPLIATLRRKQEGGRYKGDEKKRMGLLREMVDQHVEYVDAELRSDKALLQDLIRNKRKTRIILSYHDFDETPSMKKLEDIIDRMMRIGPNVIKIATYARSWEDNLKILSLIPYAVKNNQTVVAFCMGEKGGMSRIFSPLMGAAWTYAAASEKQSSAPGQMTVGRMKAIWERLG